LRSVRRRKEIQTGRKGEDKIKKRHFEVGGRGEDSGKVEEE
jgi:hypothetical protein